MSDEYRKLGHPTPQLRIPRVSGPPIGSDEITKVECPVCRGSGCVPAEVAIAADLALAMRKDSQ